MVNVEHIRSENNIWQSRPWRGYRRGYPQFAAFIADDPDRTTTIYRRFERLTAQDLLYLETEIAQLEAELDDLNDARASSKFMGATDQTMESKAISELQKGIQAGTESLQELVEQAADREGPPHLREYASRKLGLIHDIRAKLREYRTLNP